MQVGHKNTHKRHLHPEQQSCNNNWVYATERGLWWQPRKKEHHQQREVYKFHKDEVSIWSLRAMD